MTLAYAMLTAETTAAGYPTSQQAPPQGNSKVFWPLLCMLLVANANLAGVAVWFGRRRLPGTATRNVATQTDHNGQVLY